MRYYVYEPDGSLANTIECEPDFTSEYERLTGLKLDPFPEDLPPREPTELEQIHQLLTDQNLETIALGQALTDLELKQMEG